MTVQSDVSRVVHNGDGVSTVFPVPFRFIQASDLVVAVVDADGTSTAPAFAATGADSPSGGTVDLSPAVPAADQKVVIYRDPALIQPTDYTQFDDFPAETFERGQDRAIMAAQRNRDLAERSFRLADSVPASPTVSIFPIANQVLQWNDDATELVGKDPDEIVPEINDAIDAAQAIADDAAASAASASVSALDAADDAAAIAAMLAGPALTGSPTTTTPGGSDDSTRIANTEWVRDYLATLLPGPTMLKVGPVAASGVNFLDFTSIPSWATRVTVILDQISTVGANIVAMQLGTSGTPLGSGYGGGVSVTASASYTAANLSAGFNQNPGGSAANVANGRFVADHIGGNRWSVLGGFGFTNTTATATVAGAVTLGGPLDVIRVGSADDFDSGTVTVIYEG